MNSSFQGADARIVFQAVNLENTPGIQAMVYEKFGALLKHNDHIVRIEVHLKKSQTIGHHPLFTAMARLEIGGPDLVANDEGKDAYGLLEALAAKLARLLAKRQGIRKEKRNHPHDAEIGEGLPKAAMTVGEDADKD
jgi:putative sigma-54 modulation protein